MHVAFRPGGGGVWLGVVYRPFWSNARLPDCVCIFQIIAKHISMFEYLHTEK